MNEQKNTPTIAASAKERQSSRDVKDLHPQLQAAWVRILTRWSIDHPGLPKPFITTAYRNAIDQNRDYAQGRTIPGRIITNARFGESRHNSYPSRALDFAFLKEHRAIYDEIQYFILLGHIATNEGLIWSGNWLNRKEYDHLEMKEEDE